MTASTRTETDSFGPIQVPADSYWGAQTQRSIENFPFGANERMPAEIVHALGFVKQAAARVNARGGGLDAALADAQSQLARTETELAKIPFLIDAAQARMGYAQTLVAPYSVRPKPEAPVATPIEWSELGRVEPRTYTVANLRRRLARKPDPWAGMADHAAAFDPVRSRLDELLAEAGRPG